MDEEEGPSRHRAHALTNPFVPCLTLSSPLLMAKDIQLSAKLGHLELGLDELGLELVLLLTKVLVHLRPLPLPPQHTTEEGGEGGHAACSIGSIHN